MRLPNLYAAMAVSASILLPQAAALAAVEPRLVIPFNADWAFQYFPASTAPEHTVAVDFDDQSWPAVATPHTWSTFETTGDVHPFIMEASERRDPYWWRGWGVYRKSFVVDPAVSRRWFIEFEGVQKVSRIYLNGHYLGENKGGYSGFSFELSEFLFLDGVTPNILTVLVSNRRDDLFGGVPPMIAGNFNVYGGIYREVRLVGTADLHFPFQGSADHEGGLAWTTPLVSARRATTRIEAWVRNVREVPAEATVTAVVRDPDGTTVANLVTSVRLPAGEITHVVLPLLSLPQPRLWCPDHPNLYSIEAVITEQDTVIDRIHSPLGFRWYEWDHATNTLHWNGRPIRINGTNRHQEYPWIGDAMPHWMHRRDTIDMRRNLNHNFTRTAHYPQDPYVYDLSDELGLITVAEVPNIKSLDFGTDIQRTHVRQMVRRLRNHPSIFMWSVGNETNRAADSAWIAELDPTRLIHQRKTENFGAHVDHDHTNLDMENLLRVTVRGWYTTEVRDLQPENSEFLPKSGQETGTEAWQHEQARVRDSSIRGIINEQGVAWLYADHGADRNYRNSPLQNVNAKGWVDLFRFPKYLYTLWQANWAQTPMVFVRPFYWQQDYLGQQRPIQVDANADEVELLVNGRSLGRRPLSDATFRTTEFPMVTIERGTLTGIAYRNGVESARHVVEMPGPAAAIRLVSSHAQIQAGRDGLAEIQVHIVDQHGIPVIGARPDLHWEITGPGSLAGPAFWTHDSDKNLEASGCWYIDTPVANLVRSGARPGTVRVRVSAAGLATGEVVIRTVAAPPAHPAVHVVPLADAGRLPVARLPGFQQPLPRLAVLANRSGDNVRFALDAQGSRIPSLLSWIAVLHQHPLPGDSVFTTLLERLDGHARRTGGELIMDDYNFEANRYNDQRSLERFIADLPFHPDFRNQWVEHLRDTRYAGGQPIDLEAQGEFFRAIPTEGRFVIAVLSSNTRQVNDEYRRTEYLHRVRAPSLDAILAHFEPDWENLPEDDRAAIRTYLAKINPPLLQPIELEGRTSPLRLRIWIPEFSAIPRFTAAPAR